jgi:glutamate dehydrogenase (NADP+)
MLKDGKSGLEGKKIIISGSGNVAVYAAQKALSLGAKVIAMSDSGGYVFDENGINIDAMKECKEIKRARISEYAKETGCEYKEGCCDIWKIPCDIALPCATQNELDGDAAKALVKNGCRAVCEGANMPSTPEAVKVFLDAKIAYGPAKAANAGGVATSGLEMSQNSQRLAWTFDEVDAKLRQIMINIHKSAKAAAEEYGTPGNLVNGANIAGFIKVAKVMKLNGVI